MFLPIIRCTCVAILLPRRSDVDGNPISDISDLKTVRAAACQSLLLYRWHIYKPWVSTKKCPGLFQKRYKIILSFIPPSRLVSVFGNMGQPTLSNKSFCASESLRNFRWYGSVEGHFICDMTIVRHSLLDHEAHIGWCFVVFSCSPDEFDPSACPSAFPTLPHSQTVPSRATIMDSCATSAAAAGAGDLCYVLIGRWSNEGCGMQSFIRCNESSADCLWRWLCLLSTETKWQAVMP